MVGIYVPISYGINLIVSLRALKTVPRALTSIYFYSQSLRSIITMGKQLWKLHLIQHNLKKIDVPCGILIRNPTPEAILQFTRAPLLVFALRPVHVKTA